MMLLVNIIAARLRWAHNQRKYVFLGPNGIGYLAWLIKLSFRITTLTNLSRRMLLLISNLVIMYLCIYVNVGR
jgi:hypothetical protein